MGKPRLGFVGVGWIGRHRMAAILAEDAVVADAIFDPSDANLIEALGLAPDARRCASFEEVLARDLDGIVVATPSALHADQAVAALARGAAVFCQKPLGRNLAEVRRVTEAARRAGKLLAVDFSYRETAAVTAIRDVLAAGRIGRPFAIDLVFHNAYGPDKPWFYERAQAGGGCLMDLGIHLIDLALTLTGARTVRDVSAHLFEGGAPLTAGSNRVEDYAAAQFALDDNAVVRLACSWRLHAGQDADIRVEIYGTKGGVALRNHGGSFYDFGVDLFDGTSRQVLVTPPDDWGGRAAQAWARRLAEGCGYDPRVEDVCAATAVMDAIYAAAEPRALQSTDLESTILRSTCP